MPDPLEVPNSVMGRHVDSTTELVELTHTILRHNSTVSHGRSISFEHSGRIRAISDGDELTVLVPLPYLDFVGVSTDELQSTLGMFTKGQPLTVDVAPPP